MRIGQSNHDSIVFLKSSMCKKKLDELVLCWSKHSYQHGVQQWINQEIFDDLSLLNVDFDEDMRVFLDEELEETVEIVLGEFDVDFVAVGGETTLDKIPQIL